MSRKFLNLFIFVIAFSNIFCEKRNGTKKIQRTLKSNPLFNSASKNVASLKFHSKLLQTVYSDSFSKNYYYTTLYVGDKRVKQTYIIDTASSIMASPCSPCSECGQHKNPIYYDKKRNHKPLKCRSKICQLAPANTCLNKKLKFLSSAECSFKINRQGDGIMGYFIKDIVYFETDRKVENAKYHRKTYRSYAIPVGCTTAELGEYKRLNTDGIMGMNNNPKSFISLLYNLKIVNRNIFSLCFGLRGGYMSLGEIDKTYHKSEDIEYIPLLNSNIYYLVKLNSVTVGNSEKNALNIPLIASIDTGNTISYFPSITFKRIKKQFMKYCNKQEDNCGNFTYDNKLGYCATFPDRETLFKAIYQYWPNITLKFGESEYIWKPINYYYYHIGNNERKACLGFDYHSSTKIILGANFIHNHDIIFDRAKQKLGFVPSDCSRGDLIMNKWFNNNKTETENTIEIDKNISKTINKTVNKIIHIINKDKEIHHSESENKFHFGDNNKDDMIDFIQGHNTELDRKEFSSVNLIILITSILLVTIIILIVVSVLLCGKKKLIYEVKENEYVEDEIEDNNSNKIGIEENKEEPENNLEDSK